MRRLWVFGWLVLLCGAVGAQEPPLINYAAGVGEFESDELPPGFGLQFGDGISDDVDVYYSSGANQFFNFAIDTDEKISGAGSQRITFSRTGSSSATAALSVPLYFPSEDYPQVGETIRISFWFKTSNWTNARLRLLARGLDGQSPTTELISRTDPAPTWTRLEATYVVPSSNPQGVDIRLEIALLDGTSTGTLWLDNLEVYGSKRWRTRPPRSFKIFTYYNPFAPDANADWIYYAREFDMVGVFFGTVELRRMLTYRPDLKTTTYYLGFVSENGSGTETAVRDPFDYHYCDQYYPEWFLLNFSGQRLRYASTTYFMDVGNPDCARHAARRIYARMAKSNLAFYSIKLDHFISFISSMVGCARYPTRASRIAAVTKYLMTLKRELQDFGPPMLVCNVAGRTFSREWIHTYLIRQGLYDGILYEQAFTRIFNVPADYVAYTYWDDALRTLVEFENTIRIYYSGYTLNPARMRPMKLYAMASFLLGCNDLAFIYLDKHYYEGQPFGRQRVWRPDADYDVPLGQPTGPYEVYFRSNDYRGGLYYRPFQNGFVLVNPTGNISPYWKDGAVFTWVLDDTYYEWVTQQSYPAGTRIKLYPKQARIFIRQQGLTAPPGDGQGALPPAKKPQPAPGMSK